MNIEPAKRRKYWVSGVSDNGFFPLDLISPPSFHTGFYHGGEWDGEKDAPKTPQPSEDKHRDDDADGVNVYCFGEDERHDNVAVQDLHHEIKGSDPIEIRGEAVLHISDDQYGNSDDGCANVGDKH